MRFSFIRPSSEFPSATEITLCIFHRSFLTHNAATETSQFPTRHDRLHLCHLLDASQRLQPRPGRVQSVPAARRSRNDADYLRRLSRTRNVISLRQPMALWLVQRQLPQRVPRHCQSHLALFRPNLPCTSQADIFFGDGINQTDTTARWEFQRPERNGRR